MRTGEAMGPQPNDNHRAGKISGMPGKPRLKVSPAGSPCAMNDPLDFTGKVVLVTGSSRGLGAAMIKAFGDRGAQCVVNFISDPEGTNKKRCDERRARR